MVKKFVFILGLFYGTADAHILHVGEKTFQLDAVKRTSPALCVGIGDDVFYGTLYPGDAPAETLHVRRGTSEYWLGQNCPAGTYSETGISACTDCGVGHYCTGGSHRAACTGGIIGCPGTRATADASAPEFANRILTADEIAENVTPTNLSQWRQISCCSDIDNDYYKTLKEDLSQINTVSGCAGGPLMPGTYLFTVRTGSWCPMSDPFYGVGCFSTDIMVFDHTVSYKTIHAQDIFSHFLDLDGPDFTNYDLKIPGHSFVTVDTRANVDGLADVPRVMCVYELK